VINLRSPTPFEEVYHTAQFNLDGGAGPNFYTRYGYLSLGGILAAGDSYKGNLYEAFAQGASKRMFEEYLRQNPPGQRKISDRPISKK